MVDYNRFSGEKNNEPPRQQLEGKPSGRASRFWMGCCGGCAGIILVSLAVAVISIYMLFRSQPVPPPETFFLPDADGFAVVRIAPDDEGLIAFLQSLAKNPPAAMEFSEEEKEILREGADVIPERLEKWAPVNLVSVFYHLDHPEEAKDDDFTLPGVEDKLTETIVKWLGARSEMRRFDKGMAGSLRRAGGMMRLIVRLTVAAIAEQGGDVDRYRGVRLGKSPAGFTIGALNNNLMVADSEKIIFEWVDALKEDVPEDVSYKGPAALEGIYRRLELPSPFFFAVSNRKGEIQSALQSFREMYDDLFENNFEMQQVISGTANLTDNMHALGGTFRITGPDRAELDIYAECTSAEYARQVSGGLVNILKELVDNDIAIEGSVDGLMAHIRFIHHDFEGFIRGMSKSQPGSVHLQH